MQGQDASPVPVWYADEVCTITAVDGPVGEAYVEVNKAFSDLPSSHPERCGSSISGEVMIEDAFLAC